MMDLMARRIVLLCLMGLVVVGCAVASNLAAPRQRQLADRIWNECRAEASTRVKGIECLATRWRPAIAASGYPDMDLVDLMLAYIGAIVRRMDAGTISAEDANLAFAELQTRIQSESQRRDALRAQQAYQAQQAQQSQRLLQQMNERLPGPPITCIWNGPYFVHCQ